MKRLTYWVMPAVAIICFAVGCGTEADTGALNVNDTTLASTELTQDGEASGSCCSGAQETAGETVVAKQGNSKECCGKCEGETGETVATQPGDAKGCCGKCQTESAVSVAAKKGDAKECCGQCEGESAVGTAAGAQEKKQCCGQCDKGAAKDQAGSKADTCGKCNACAEGDSENCQCEGEATTASNSGTKSIDQPVYSNRQDRDIFHFLLRNHEKIVREVKELDNGVRTVTRSDDPAIAAKIQEHVASMHGRVESGRRLRMWDDLFREIFKVHDKIKMKVKKTKDGVEVIETSEDKEVAKLIKAHAKVVSGFVKRGFDEARENHPVPTGDDAEPNSGTAKGDGSVEK